MKKIYFALPGNESLAKTLTALESAETGKMDIRKFPDGESYVRVLSDVKDKEVVLICTLHQPDEKVMLLLFLAETIRNLGAHSVRLVVPYLAYMRQDKAFHPGESVTSVHFAKLVSNYFDSLITIDPHLHRHSSLNEIYSIPTHIGHAANHISKWIKENVSNPVLIGPDGESQQWVSEVAKNAGAPYTVLTKTRYGDRDVKVSLPHLEAYKDHTPVLVDDIISTGRTMIETIDHLKMSGMKAPVCIGVHAVFAANAYQDMKTAGAAEIVTCNTIPHQSNKIDVSDLLTWK